MSKNRGGHKASRCGDAKGCPHVDKLPADVRRVKRYLCPAANRGAEYHWLRPAHHPLHSPDQDFVTAPPMAAFALIGGSICLKIPVKVQLNMSSMALAGAVE